MSGPPSLQRLRDAVNLSNDREANLVSAVGAARGEAILNRNRYQPDKPALTKTEQYEAAYSTITAHLLQFEQFGWDFEADHQTQLNEAETKWLATINNPTEEDKAKAKVEALLVVMKDKLKNSQATARNTYIVPKQQPGQDIPTYFSRVKEHYASRLSCNESERQQMKTAVENLCVPKLKVKLLAKITEFETWTELEETATKQLKALAELGELQTEVEASSESTKPTNSSRTPSKAGISRNLARSEMRPEHQEMTLQLFPKGVEEGPDMRYDRRCYIHGSDSRPAGHMASACSAIRNAVQWADKVPYPRQRLQQQPHVMAARMDPQQPGPSSASMDALATAMSLLGNQIAVQSNQLATLSDRVTVMAATPATATPQPFRGNSSYSTTPRRDNMTMSVCHRCKFKHMTDGKTCDVLEPWNVQGRTLMFGYQPLNYKVRESWVGAGKPVPPELEERIRQLDARFRGNSGTGRGQDLGRPPGAHVLTVADPGSSSSSMSVAAPFVFVVTGGEDQQEISVNQEATADGACVMGVGGGSEPTVAAATRRAKAAADSGSTSTPVAPPPPFSPKHYSSRTEVPSSYIPVGGAYRREEQAAGDRHKRQAAAICELIQRADGQVDENSLVSLLQSKAVMWDPKPVQAAQQRAAALGTSGVVDPQQLTSSHTSKVEGVTASATVLSVKAERQVTFSDPISSSEYSSSPSSSSGFYQLPADFPVASSKAGNKGWWMTPPEGQPGSIMLKSSNGQSWSPGSALCDTGADVNIISHAAAKQLGCKYTEGRHPSVSNLGDAPTRSLGVVTLTVRMLMGKGTVGTELGWIERELDFMVVDTDMFSVLLGSPGMDAYGMILDHQSDTAFVRHTHNLRQLFYFSMKRLHAPRVAIAAHQLNTRLSNIRVFAAPPSHLLDTPRALLLTAQLQLSKTADAMSGNNSLINHEPLTEEEEQQQVSDTAASGGVAAEEAAAENHLEEEEIDPIEALIAASTIKPPNSWPLPTHWYPHMTAEQQQGLVTQGLSELEQQCSDGPDAITPTHSGNLQLLKCVIEQLLGCEVTVAYPSVAAAAGKETMPRVSLPAAHGKLLCFAVPTPVWLPLLPMRIYVYNPFTGHLQWMSPKGMEDNAAQLFSNSQLEADVAMLLERWGDGNVKPASAEQRPPAGTPILVIGEPEGPEALAVHKIKKLAEITKAQYGMLFDSATMELQLLFNAALPVLQQQGGQVSGIVQGWVERLVNINTRPESGWLTRAVQQAMQEGVYQPARMLQRTSVPIGKPDLAFADAVLPILGRMQGYSLPAQLLRVAVKAAVSPAAAAQLCSDPIAAAATLLADRATTASQANAEAEEQEPGRQLDRRMRMPPTPHKRPRQSVHHRLVSTGIGWWTWVSVMLMLTVTQQVGASAVIGKGFQPDHTPAQHTEHQHISWAPGDSNTNCLQHSWSNGLLQQQNQSQCLLGLGGISMHASVSITAAVNSHFAYSNCSATTWGRSSTGGEKGAVGMCATAFDWSSMEPGGSTQHFALPPQYADVAGWLATLTCWFQLLSSCLVAAIYWAYRLRWIHTPGWLTATTAWGYRAVHGGLKKMGQWTAAPTPRLMIWRSDAVRQFFLFTNTKTKTCRRSVKTSADKHAVALKYGKWISTENTSYRSLMTRVNRRRWVCVLAGLISAMVAGVVSALVIAATGSAATVAAAFQVTASETLMSQPKVLTAMCTTFPDGYQHLAHSPNYTKDTEHGWMYGNHPEFTADQQTRLTEMLNSKKHCFAYQLSDLPGYCGDQGPFTLDLTTDKPIFAPKRRTSPLEQEVADNKCGELRDAGIIVRCPYTKYAAAPVIAAKKDLEGKLTDQRFCLDMRPQNNHTELDRYPMHLPEDIFQSVQGSKFFTKIDLRAGFHQITIAREDQQKTAFWWNGELWMYTRMIFGLKNSPAKFQRVMDYEIQKAGLNNCCCSFIDDLLIHSKTAEEHLQHIAAVLDMLHSCGLRAHPSKSVFAAETIEYLGHNVSPYGTAPNEVKIAAVKETPNPTNVEGLRSMLGFFNYYRCYVPRYSELAKPLNALLAKDAVWQWGQTQQEAKDKIVAELCTEGRALRRVDPTKPLVVHTDWSSAGISAILGQRDEQGKEYMCACISRSCNKAERSYSSYEGEMLAAVWGIKSFRCYLHGRPFTLVTDHQPLTWLMSNLNLTGKHARWALSLMDYEFDILHRPGKTHQNADFLSRHPRADTTDGTGARLDEDGDKIRRVPKVIGTVKDDYCSPSAFLAQYGSRTSSHQSVTEHGPATTALETASFPLAALAPTHSCLLAGNLGAVDDMRWSTPPEDAATAQLHTAALNHQASKWVRRALPLTPDTTEHQPLQLTGPADQYGLRAATALHTQPVGQQFFESAADQGVVLIELFAGMASGLEMALRNGIRVKHYIYSDKSTAAQAIARHRIAELQAKYPQSFPFDAAGSAFDTLPQDVYSISAQHWVELAQQHAKLPWLIVAGWECQDLSPAGQCKGLQGPRSSSFFNLVKHLGWIQQLRLTGAPTAYLLENTAFQYNFNSTKVADEDYATVTAAVGPAITFDAAQAGSRAHRLRHYWTNLCSHTHLQQVLAQIPRPPGTVSDILHPHHTVQTALYTDKDPFHPCNVKGQPLTALPTLVAYTQSRAFRPEKQGSVWNMCTNQWEEPDPVERERALGYADNTTAAPRVTDKQRHEATGNCMDANAMQVLCAVSKAVARLLTARGQLPPSAPPVSVTMQAGEQDTPNTVIPPCPPVSAAVVRGGTGNATAMQHNSCSHDREVTRQNTKQEATMQTVAENILASEQLAAVAEAEEKQAGPSEVWEDEATIALLQGSSKAAALPAAVRNRAAERARRYQWVNGTLMRRMADNTLRLVPEPKDRIDIIQRTHEITGHFGQKRTISMLKASYWWKGMSTDVTQVVGSCAICDRVNASFNAQSPVLNPLPIRGLLYRWGVDLCGPFPETSNHNVYVLVAVEYFSKHVELVPLPSKEAKHTRSAFLHNVLARFGACAEVVTDRGTEWEGEFQQLLEQALIDHRRTSAGHPQADGLAERCVQVVKRALRKHCAVSGNTTDWDETLAWIALGYRCSRHESTGFSPYMLLYGKEPIIPPAIMERMAEPLQLDDPEAAARMVMERAALMKRNAAIAGENLRIAQHRDTLRYATVRSGAYQPQLRKFEAGDYVYVRRAVTSSTLQTQARPLILRVIEVKPSGVCTLRGRDGLTMDVHVQHLAPCHLPVLDPDTAAAQLMPAADMPCEVCLYPDDEQLMILCDVCNTGWHAYCLNPKLDAVPEGEWVCPRCTSAGLKPTAPQQSTATAVETQPATEAAGPNSSDGGLSHEPRFRSAKTKAEDARAANYDGRLVRKSFIDPDTKLPRKYWGRVVFRGPEARPKYFLIQYEDGDQETLSLESLRAVLQPESADLPPGVSIPEVSNAPAAMAAAFASREVQIRSVRSALEAKEWDLQNPSQVTEILQLLMPGEREIAKPHAGRISSTVAGKNGDSGKWGVPTTAELDVLLRVVNLAGAAAVADPFTKTAAVEEYLTGREVSVARTDRSTGINSRLQPQRYRDGKKAAGLEMVVTCPNPKLLDVVMPLMAVYVSGAVCALVPGHYVTNLPGYRRKWLRELLDQGRVLMIMGVPKGAAALQAVWLCVFASKAQKKALVNQQYQSQDTVQLAVME